MSEPAKELKAAMKSLNEAAAIKGTELIRQHKGNCRDAAKAAERCGEIYAEQKDYKNCGFWLDVAAYLCLY